MATTQVNTLQLKFRDTNDEMVSFNFSPSSANPSSANVKTLMNTMITNNSIWQKNPEVAVSAKVVQKITSDIDISE